MTTQEHQSKIEYNFSKHAKDYDKYSDVQKQIAQLLINSLADNCIPQTILEIGCGTGTLTQMLAQKFPNAEITATDISHQMIKSAQTNWPDSIKKPQWKRLNGQNIHPDMQFDLIISNMTIQWFENIPKTYKQWLNHLNPDGIIITSRPAITAFHEWKSSLEAIEQTSGLIEHQCTNAAASVQTIELKQSYTSTFEFLKSIKKTGAHTAQKGYTPLSPTKIKQACKYCDKTYNAEISWDVQIDRITKNSSYEQ